MKVSVNEFYTSYSVDRFVTLLEPCEIFVIKIENDLNVCFVIKVKFPLMLGSKLFNDGEMWRFI